MVFGKDAKVEPGLLAYAGHDQLGRENFGKSLTAIVCAMGGEAAIVLDGPWGVGKTRFVEMWRNECKLTTIYFNAFESDYHEDPFIPLCATLLKAFPPSNEACRRFVEATKKVGVALVKAGITFGLRSLTLGAIDPKDFSSDEQRKVAEAFRKDLSEVATDALTSYVSDSLDEFSKDQLKFAEFRDALQSLANASTDSPRPLVFIVDELDRCRPSFAVELVEKIKHLFNVPGVVFLLVLNQEQLGAAFSAQYGCSQSVAAKYLRKFVELNLSLPRWSGRSRDSLSELLNLRTQKAWDAVPDLKTLNCSPTYMEAVRLMVDSGYATARDVQQIVTVTVLLHLHKSEFLAAKPASTCLAVLVTLSVVSPFLFQKLLSAPRSFQKSGEHYSECMLTLGLYVSLTLAGPGEERLRAELQTLVEALTEALMKGDRITLQDRQAIDPLAVFAAVNSLPMR